MTKFAVKLAKARSDYEKFEQLLGSTDKDTGAWVDHFHSAILSVWLILLNEANESNIYEAENLQILYNRLLLERLPDLPALNEEEWGTVIMALDIFSCEEAKGLIRARNDLKRNYEALRAQYPSAVYKSTLSQVIRAIK
ncbi:MAG: hypothetical protein IH971_02215 [Candidatus Marinimicrobia bacterium]|nr:hypothetical protein [Candidatus Neomarinimicrobiota bacterium]